MQSINSLSCSNDQLATMAGYSVLREKMIAELNAKVNFIPDKATPIDATVSRAFELALAGFNTSPARLKLPAPAYLLTEVVKAFVCLNPLYLARLLNVLSNKTANYLRGIFQRSIDAMTFKNNFKNLNNLLFNFGVKHHAVKSKKEPSTPL